jgi:hypothetical protein
MDTALPQPQMGLTFEQVWATMVEQNREHARRSEEQARRSEEQDKKFEQFRAAMAEQNRELEREMRLSHEKTERQMQLEHEKTEKMIRENAAALEETRKTVDRVCKNVGGLNRSMGELIETLIAARLWEKFADYPYNLQRAYQRIPLFDEKNHVLTDIDILLTDSDYVMAVEVKAELNRKDDVDHHLKRMERILKYPPDQCKGRKLLGAMAGGAVDPDVRDYAHAAGFFVLELTGESVALTKRPEGFMPREWHP